MTRAVLERSWWLVVLAACGLAGAQTASPPPAEDQALPPQPNVIPESTEQSPEQKLTLEQSLEQAVTLIRTAEARADGWDTAMRQASQIINAVLAADPGNAVAAFYVARLNVLLGRTGDAIRPIERYTETRQGRTDWEGHWVLGNLYFTSGVFKLALSRYGKASELNPVEPKIEMSIAQCQLQLNNKAKAIEHARRAIALSSEPTAEQFSVLARALASNQQFDEATEAARKAVEVTRAGLTQAPGSATLLGQLNNYYVQLNQLITDMLSRDPQRLDQYARLAQQIEARAEVQRLQLLHQAYEVAARGVQAAGDQAPAELMLEAARLAYAVGKTDEAVNLLNKTLTAYPDHPQAQGMLSEINSR